MNYKITDEQRKLLTEEVLGEKLHEPVSDTDCLCGRPGIVNAYIHCANVSRTFITDQDRTDVLRAIRDKGKWAYFYRYAGKHWLKDDDAWQIETPLETWLFLDNSERACCLAAKFWKEGGK